MSEPTTRLSQCFEWGMNCATMELEKDRSSKILDEFGITDRQERDFFWMGYTEGPRANGEIVKIALGPSQ